MRRLLVTRRQVPLDLSDDYLLAWDALRKVTSTLGGRAWLFRAAAQEDWFLEFIEWQETATDPLNDDGVNAARAQLDAFAPAADVTEWEEEA